MSTELRLKEKGVIVHFDPKERHFKFPDGRIAFTKKDALMCRDINDLYDMLVRREASRNN